MTEWDEFDIENAAIYLHDHGHGDLADHVRSLLADYKQLSGNQTKYRPATYGSETGTNAVHLSPRSTSHLSVTEYQ